MLECGRRPCLAIKTRARVVAIVAEERHFERDLPVELAIVSLENGPHAAFAKAVANAIAAELARNAIDHGPIGTAWSLHAFLRRRQRSVRDRRVLSLGRRRIGVRHAAIPPARSSLLPC